jgi:hypothetical protein
MVQAENGTSSMPTIYFVATSPDTPIWLHTVGTESGGRFWLPAIFGVPGNPCEFVKRQSSYFASRSIERNLARMAETDGIERLIHMGHLFLPMSWIISVNPEARPFCHQAVRMLQQHQEQVA